jgi:hypothetical protein
VGGGDREGVDSTEVWRDGEWKVKRNGVEVDHDFMSTPWRYCVFRAAHHSVFEHTRISLRKGFFSISRVEPGLMDNRTSKHIAWKHQRMNSSLSLSHSARPNGANASTVP